jgi:hypothetical protein
MKKYARKHLGLPEESPKKLKTKEQMIEWFGDKSVNVHIVLDAMDNRIFRKLYNDGVFLFDIETRTYRVNKEKTNE